LFKDGEEVKDNLVKRQNKERIMGMDIIRGLALINMIAYHLLYDLVYIFGVSISWFSIRQCFVWQQAICFTFILVSGVSFKLSKNLRKRGLIILLCAVILTISTYLVMPEQLILFGILHFLGSAVFLTILVQPIIKRIPAAIGLPAALFLFILFRYISSGYLSFFSLWQFPLSSGLYKTPFLFFLGLPNAAFSSADYFPLLPWWFLYLGGYYLAEWLFKLDNFFLSKYPLSQVGIYRALHNSLGFMGRKSLIIYMFHQPIIYGALVLMKF